MLGQGNGMENSQMMYFFFLNSSSIVFSQHWVQIILFLAKSMRASLKGLPSNWINDVLYGHIIYYEVVMGPRVN